MDAETAQRPRPRARPVPEIIPEAVVVVAAVAVVVGLARAPQVGGTLDPHGAMQVLTLAAAAVAAVAALLGPLAARLADDPRPRWIGAALALYAVVVLPTAALVAPAGADWPLRTMRLVAYLVTMALLIAAAAPPRRVGAAGTWALTAAGALLAVAALGAPAVAPGAVRALVEGPVVTVAVLVGWTASAAAVLVEGLRRRSAPRRRAGLGLVVLAGAQLHRVLTGAPSSPDVVFGALRLLGLVLVVVGLAQLVARTLARQRSDQFAQQEALALAALHMERAEDLAAERDHELRNGLAGLAGITHLLSSPVDGADHDRLRHAVLAELSRLHTLLENDLSFAVPDPTPERGYLVAPVLDGLVALRRSAGADVDLDVEPGLRAVGDAGVLAQVVTNLLANCDRHAPGAALTVRGRAEGDRVRVEVRDTGPGLPPGVRDAVRDGAHDASAGGRGIGLSISERLVVREGGTLTVETVRDPLGCLATVLLPRPLPERATDPEPAQPAVGAATRHPGLSP